VTVSVSLTRQNWIHALPASSVDHSWPPGNQGSCSESAYVIVCHAPSRGTGWLSDSPGCASYHDVASSDVECAFTSSPCLTDTHTCRCSPLSGQRNVPVTKAFVPSKVIVGFTYEMCGFTDAELDAAPFDDGAPSAG